MFAKKCCEDDIETTAFMTIKTPVRASSSVLPRIMIRVSLKKCHLPQRSKQRQESKKEEEKMSFQLLFHGCIFILKPNYADIRRKNFLCFQGRDMLPS